MEKLFKEEWRPIKGYEGLYEVSSLGNVRSVGHNVCFLNHRKCADFHRDGKLLKLTVNKQGYCVVGLYDASIKKAKLYKVHRLVAEAFIPNVENKPMIDHINTIKTDNRVENLRWCSQKENCNNPLTRERNKNRPKEVHEKMLATKREKQSIGCEIPVYFFNKDGSKISFKSMAEAERQMNVPKYCISRSVNKKRPILGRQWYKEEKATV